MSVHLLLYLLAFDGKHMLPVSHIEQSGSRNDNLLKRLCVMGIVSVICVQSIEFYACCMMLIQSKCYIQVKFPHSRFYGLRSEPFNVLTRRF